MEIKRTDYSEKMLAIGTRIRQLRERNSLTMEEMAEVFEVSYQSVSNWELGRSIPNWSRIGQLREYFNVSADYILFGDNVTFAA